MHDTETGSKAREPRDNRITSQRAAVARGCAREGAAFVARTCPTKSTVVQPHLSALSCAPMTCTAALVPRAKERANRMPLSTREYASSTHELATRSSSEGTMDSHSPQGGTAPRVCFGNTPQPPKGCRPTSARGPLGYARGRVLEYHVPSTRTVRVPQPRGTHHVDLDEARASDLPKSTCARARREKRARRPLGQRGREGATDGGSEREYSCARVVHVRGACNAVNRRKYAVPGQRLCGGIALGIP